MAGVPGESYSEPEVYTNDDEEELGEMLVRDTSRGCWSMDFGSLGIGSLGWLVDDSVMQVCCAVSCACIL